MSIAKICEKRWKIYFYIEGDNCPINEYIENKFSKKAQDHIYACFDMLAERGRTALNIDMFHSSADGDEVRSEGQIYKMYGLHKSKERLYSILHEATKTIIFTHGAIKAGKKTAKEDICKFKDIVQNLIDEGVLQ